MMFLELHRFTTGALVLVNIGNIEWLGPRTTAQMQTSRPGYPVPQPDFEPASDGGTTISMHHGETVVVRENYPDILNRISSFQDVTTAGMRKVGQS